jgi:hypothetical protein
MQKFGAELAELEEECRNGDRIGALLEAADCLYYATKALYNGQITGNGFHARMSVVYRVSGFTAAQVEAAAKAKYSLRARPGNPKNDAAERAAVAHLI